MPELPDVEVFRRYLDATTLHQQISAVEVSDARVLDSISRRELTATLVGHEFSESGRYGKYLFAHLDDGPWLVLHFGMSGQLQYFEDIAQKPEHTRVLIAFVNGYHLAYDSQRMLGRVEIAGDPDEIITKHDLGPDAFDINADEFQQLIGGRRGTIKSALMNQRLLSGIGNIYTDEILFQSGVHPRTKPGDLDLSELLDLYEAMRSVLTQSIDAHADPAQMPDSFLLPHRAEGGACPNCGEKIATTKISGRRTFYCPQCQPRQES